MSPGYQKWFSLPSPSSSPSPTLPPIHNHPTVDHPLSGNGWCSVLFSTDAASEQLTALYTCTSNLLKLACNDSDKIDLVFLI